jgi:hypothetical protein
MGIWTALRASMSVLEGFLNMGCKVKKSSFIKTLGAIMQN